jgi:hypothetical protein
LWILYRTNFETFAEHHFLPNLRLTAGLRGASGNATPVKGETGSSGDSSALERLTVFVQMHDVKHQRKSFALFGLEQK